VQAIVPVYCVGVTLDSTGQPTRSTYRLAAPQLDWIPSGTIDSEGNAQIYVTPRYALSVGETMTLIRTSNQNFATSGTENDITWQAIVTANNETASNAAGVISWNGTTTVTFSEAGLYLLSLHTVWAPSAVGTRGAYVITAPGGTRRAATEFPATAVTNTATELNLVITLLANATLSASALQASGGALNLLGASTATSPAGTSNRSYWQISRLQNLTLPRGRVRLLFIGGA
jgi:hypothetical protein